MINLLADAKKKEIRNGRINVVLVRYLAWVTVTGAILAGIVVAALLVLNTSRQNAQNRATDAQSQASKYSASEQQATAFRQDLATAKQILDKEVTYSKAVLRIASSLPKGIYIDSLNLDAANIGTQTSLTFNAASQDAAVALKSHLEAKPDIYSDVHFQSIDLQGEGSHPVKVTLSLVINKAILK